MRARVVKHKELTFDVEYGKRKITAFDTQRRAGQHLRRAADNSILSSASPCSR